MKQLSERKLYLLGVAAASIAVYTLWKKSRLNRKWYRKSSHFYDIYLFIIKFGGN